MSYDKMQKEVQTTYERAAKKTTTTVPKLT